MRTSLMLGTVAKASRANASRSAACVGAPGEMATKMWGSMRASSGPGAPAGAAPHNHPPPPAPPRPPRDDAADAKTREISHLEGQQAQLFVLRDGIADGERRQRRADRSIGIERFRRIGDLHRDQRGQRGGAGHQNPFVNYVAFDLL